MTDIVERLHDVNHPGDDEKHDMLVMLLRREAAAEIRALRAELEAAQKDADELHACLRDLYALVNGECPSLIEDYFMVQRYEAALDRARRAK